MFVRIEMTPEQIADLRASLVASESPPRLAGRRWSRLDEDYLRDEWGNSLRNNVGDPERAVTALANALERTPIAVAARLVQLGIWQ